jgi:TfoX/Sxy family transcriptional regulator of competence genes
MSTSKETVAFILDQLAPLPVRARAMFGEYGLYCDEKIVALICDETLFVKPTAVAGAFTDDAWLAPPYTRAKDYFAVPGERLDDREWLQAFIRATADALPAPKPKKPRAKKTAADA